jgi:hypothetical protein
MGIIFIMPMPPTTNETEATAASTIAMMRAVLVPWPWLTILDIGQPVADKFSCF